MNEHEQGMANIQKLLDEENIIMVQAYDVRVDNCFDWIKSHYVTPDSMAGAFFFDDLKAGVGKNSQEMADFFTKKARNFVLLEAVEDWLQDYTTKNTPRNRFIGHRGGNPDLEEEKKNDAERASIAAGTWGGKRERAGASREKRVWIEGKQGWWESKQYARQSTAVLAAQKLSKRGLPCEAVLHQDGCYHLYTQYNPYTR